MSSYIDVAHPERHAPYLDIPDDVIEYLHYLDFVKLRSPRTVNGYYLDLRGFFRFMMQRWQRVADTTPPDEITLTGITTADIAQITKETSLTIWITPATRTTAPRPAPVS